MPGAGSLVSVGSHTPLGGVWKNAVRKGAVRLCEDGAETAANTTEDEGPGLGALCGPLWRTVKENVSSGQWRPGEHLRQ